MRRDSKMLHYKRRLKNLGLYTEERFVNPKGIQDNGLKYNLTSFLNHGAPCSCGMCSSDKYNRAKEKSEYRKRNRYA